MLVMRGVRATRPRRFASRWASSLRLLTPAESVVDVVHVIVLVFERRQNMRREHRKRDDATPHVQQVQERGDDVELSGALEAEGVVDVVAGWVLCGARG